MLKMPLGVPTNNTTSENLKKKIFTDTHIPHQKKKKKKPIAASKIKRSGNPDKHH
jgi:hypothetical protein